MGLFDFFKSNKNIIDDNGVKEIYFDNKRSKVKERFFLKNGKRDGLCEEFYENGKLKIRSEWKNGIQNGKIYYYNDINGLLISESEIINGNYCKEYIEYDYYGNIKIINNGYKYSFYNWDAFQFKNIKVCDINVDNRSIIGIWTNYRSNGDIDYQLDFDDALQIEKMKRGDWNSDGYQVRKIKYDSFGKVESSHLIAIEEDHVPYQRLPNYSYYRFNNISFDTTEGWRGPPGIGINYITIKPVLGIDDLIKIKDETYFINGNLKKGNDENMRLVSKNKLTAVELFDRGTDKDSNRDYESAIIDFTKAIEIDGEYIDAYRYRAIAKSSLCEYDDAIQDYSKMIEINIEDLQAYSNRAYLKTILKDFKGAIEDYNKAIELDNESKLFTSRGKAKMQILDFKGAMLDFNIAVEKYPEDDSSFFGRGELKYGIADYHGAINDFNKCIEIKPKWIMSFHKRGDCRLKIEDYYGAIEDYSIVIQNRQDKYGVANPPSENAKKILASLYHNRGIARSKIKEYNDAIEDLKTALELDPNFDDAIQLLKSLKG